MWIVEKSMEEFLFKFGKETLKNYWKKSGNFGRNTCNDSGKNPKKRKRNLGYETGVVFFLITWEFLEESLVEFRKNSWKNSRKKNHWKIFEWSFWENFRMKSRKNVRRNFKKESSESIPSEMSVWILTVPGRNVENINLEFWKKSWKKFGINPGSGFFWRMSEEISSAWRDIRSSMIGIAFHFATSAGRT